MGWKECGGAGGRGGQNRWPSCKVRGKVRVLVGVQREFFFSKYINR